MNKIISALIAVVFLCSLPTFAQMEQREGPQPTRPNKGLTRLEGKGESPNRSVTVEYGAADEGGDDEIWIVPANKPEERYFLDTYELGASVLFSPDE